MSDTHFELSEEAREIYSSLAQEIDRISTDYVRRLLDTGMGCREAGSTVSHVLTVEAWRSAAAGALSVLVLPDPERFVGAAREIAESRDLRPVLELLQEERT